MRSRVLSLFLSICLCVTITAHAGIPSSERAALVAIHESTRGISWTNQTGWLGAAGTECRWFGVRCNSGETTVTGLFLGDNQLSGTLPSAIGSLSGLTELALFDNQIEGSIPREIGNLTQLERLELYANRFTGPVPKELGLLTRVTFFALGENQLAGSIPTELGNLTSAEFFSFNGNQLDGPIPAALGQLANVKTLDLAYNRIAGPIPKELGNLSTVVELLLNDNQLSGRIPPDLGRLSTLRHLVLKINQLTGPIPRELADLANLRTLDVGLNRLSGPIPPELGRLAMLERLAAQQNELTGPVPPELGDLRALIELEIGSNRLTGTIPSELGRLAQLGRLDLARNELTGSIPPELGLLTNLYVLALSENHLSGSLPRELLALSKLVSLSFYDNAIGGELPSDIARWTELQELVAFENRLEGPIPAGIGTLTKLRLLLLGANRLTGSVPSEITNLTELTFLDLRGNQLTGPLPQQMDRLSKLDNLSVPGNRLSGDIPSSITRIAALQTLRLEDNDFSGVIPPEIINLTALRFLGLRNNHLEGRIPAGIGRLTNLETLWLGGNRLAGAVPAEVGSLTRLGWIDLANNRFTGTLPVELKNLTSLIDDLSDFRYNSVLVNDAALREFLMRKQDGGEFENTQTLPPTNPVVSALTDRSAVVSWSLARYTNDEGGYLVSASTTPGGTPQVVATTPSKLVDTILVRGLRAATPYFFTVSTVTHPHGLQQNTLTSDPAPPVAATTTAAVIAPAEIELTAAPQGLVQSGGLAQNEDLFILSNVGDVAASITLTQQGDFFSQTPVSFILAGGASQTVRVTSISKPPGVYSGESVPTGTGVSAGFSIPIRLLSVAPPAGRVIAEASASRVDVSGDPLGDTTGSIDFTNRGNASLTGVAVSDVAWIEPQSGIVTIAPGANATVGFKVVRAKRPGSDGALTGSLKLVYLDGTSAEATLTGVDAQTTGPGISVSTVSIVDTARPPVGLSPLPPIPPGEVVRFLPGVTQTSGTGRLVSDLFISNSFGVTRFEDLRLYFSPAAAPANSSVAILGSLAPVQSVQVSSVVSLYGSSPVIGTIQVRTAAWDQLLVNAATLSLTPAGSIGTALPVFRSDRGAGQGETLRLPGVSGSGRLSTDLYLQEVSGNPASVSLEFAAPNGNIIGSTATVALVPFGMVELKSAVPDGAVSALVTNKSGSTGRVVAHAMVIDSASGDRWSIVDWSRYFAFDPSQEVKVGFARATGAASARRRPVRRGSAGGSGAIDMLAEADGEVRSDLVVMNTGETVASGSVRFHSSNGTVSEKTFPWAPRETKTFSDVLASQFGQSRNAAGYLSFVPHGGRFALSSRTYLDVGPAGTLGSAVPPTLRSSGLRLGQSQIFSGVEDASAATIRDRKPGTFRTGMAIVENGEGRARVRATFQYSDSRSVVARVIAKDYEVSTGQFLQIDSITSSILGPVRSSLGDLRNLQLEVRVIDGPGAVSIVLIATDNGTGDVFVRAE